MHASIPEPKKLTRDEPKDTPTCAYVKLWSLLTRVNMARLRKRGLFTEGQVSCTVFTVVSYTLLLCNLASVSSAVVFEYILNEDTLMHVAAPVRIGLLVHPVNAHSCRALLLLTRLTGKNFQRKQRLVRKSQQWECLFISIALHFDGSMP